MGERGRRDWNIKHKAERKSKPPACRAESRMSHILDAVRLDWSQRVRRERSRAPARRGVKGERGRRDWNIKHKAERKSKPPACRAE